MEVVRHICKVEYSSKTLSNSIHRDKPYEILKIQQEILTGISGECLIILMPANAVKMQMPVYFGILCIM